MLLGFIIAGAVVGYLAIGCLVARVSNVIANHLAKYREDMPVEIAAMLAIIWPAFVFGLAVAGTIGSLGYIIGKFAGGK